MPDKSCILFRNLAFIDDPSTQAGSGMRNSYKYTKLYSGAEPEFIEGDVFRIIIPLTTGSMIKVGGRSTSEEGELQHAAYNTDISLKKLIEILEFCNEPRTRAELQEFCGYKSPSHFREKILAPLLAGKQLVLTIPDKPNSPKQKYVRRTSPRA